MASFRSIKNPIVIATSRVVIFWWVALTLLDVEAYGTEVVDPDEVILRMSFLAAGILFGFCYIAFEVFAFRQAQRRGTEKGNQRGLFSSLGPPPLLKPPPAQAKNIPSKLPYPPDINDRFLDQWFAKYETSHPSHVALMKALLRVYAHDLSLPATHIAGGHGGRTLMTHSLLVCGLMLRLAETWGYSGLRGKSGRLVLALRDPGYVFTPNDPMVGIVALAHDIGKIECYIKDSKGQVVDSKFEHDQVGGRMLGRMDEVWNLPDTDRQLLTSVVSFYHRPQELPLANGGLACDDRTIAVMELLIRADATASRLENGQTETEASQCDEVVPEQEKDSMWGAFCELMMQSGRINGPSASFRLGQKNSSETGTALVYLHETSLRKALAKQMGVDEGVQLGDRSYMLTRSLLKVLQEHGVLYQHHNEASFSDSRALFNVEFHNKKGDKLATWPATIIIEPGVVLPTLSNLPDFTSFPTISRATFGAHSAKNKRQDLLSAFADGADPESLMTLAPAEEAPSDAAPKKKFRKAPHMADDASGHEDAPPCDAPQPVTDEASEHVQENPTEEPVHAPDPRLKDLPSECPAAPLEARMAYLLTHTKLEHTLLPDGRIVIRLDWLPESMEQQILAMSSFPDGFERQSKKDREFLICKLGDDLEYGSPVAQAPLTTTSTQRDTPPLPDGMERISNKDREFVLFVAPTESTALEASDPAPADGQTDWVAQTEADDAQNNLGEASEEPSDDGNEIIEDCFDEFSEEVDDDEDGEGGVAIDLPPDEDIDATPDAPAPSETENVASPVKDTRAEDLQAVLAAESVLRIQLKTGRVKYTLLDNGSLLLPMTEVIQFNARWGNLPELIDRCGDLTSIHYVQKGEKKAIILSAE